MSLDDQFTLIQLDRDEENRRKLERDALEKETLGRENSGSEQRSSGYLQGESPERGMNSPLLEDENEDIPEEEVDEIQELVQEPHKELSLGKSIDNSLDVTPDIDYFGTYSITSNVTTPIRDVDSNSKPYISYLISTTTDNPKILKLSNNINEFSVRRRYEDFRHLHDTLSKDYPTYLIPPLPSKSNFKYLTGDTFSHEFVKKRLNSLNRFIKFITTHKYLSQAGVFHIFIIDSQDWTIFTKTLIADPIISVNEDFTEGFMNLLTPAKHKKQSNKDILEINDKLKKLYDNLIKLDKLFSKLNKKNKDLAIDYSHFANHILKLSEINDNSDDNKVADSAIISNFKTFADSLTFFSKSWENSHKYIDETFLVSLKDCSRYIISLTNLITLEYNKKIDLQVLHDYLNKSKNELASLSGNSGSFQSSAPSNGLVNTTTQLIKDTLSTSATPNIGSSVTDAKIEKIQRKINNLNNEIEIQTKLVNDLTHNIINEEYPEWDKFNRDELKDSMVGLCDEQISFYRGLIDNWSEVELKLYNRLKELS